MKWSICGMVSPLPTSMHGMRISVASSTMSAVVRSVVQARITGLSSSQRSVRPTTESRPRSSAHCGWPIMAQKSHQCWSRLTTANPT